MSIAPGVDLVESDGEGVVVLWGMATWHWAPGDVATRRIAAVQLLETHSASRRAVSIALGVDESP